MAVLIRSGNWHYRFNYNGKICSGRCTGCNTERQALAYEQQMRKKAEEIHGSKNIKALLENYREELVGGRKVALKDAVKYASSKASAKQVTEKYEQQRSHIWDCFLDYMKHNNPDVAYIHQVNKLHIEGFLAERKSLGIMSTSLRLNKNMLSFVFTACGEEAGVLKNPCADIAIKRETNVIQREIFTEDELRRIMERATIDPLIGNMFVIAGATGLSCVDICYLRWNEINFQSRLIHRKRQKTGVDLVIPMNDTVVRVLAEQYKETAGSEYVSDTLKSLYDAGNIINKINEYLAACNIQTSVMGHNGRRKNIKGIHSMRHVFCYYAGKSGIPLHIVQSIVGHMSPEMTKHYMAHATINDKRQAIDMLPGLLCANNGNDVCEVKAEDVIELVRTASQEQLRKIMAILDE